MAAGDVWSRVACTQVVDSAGCVSFCLFSANWPNTSSADEDDCLSNRPAPPEAHPAHDEMLEAEDEARSMLPPQNGEPPSSSPTSHSSESPIKRRPGSKAGAGRAQSKKLRKSLAPASRQPLGSIPEHEQRQTWPVGMLKGRRLQFAGTLRHHLTILERRKSAHTP